MKNVSNPFGLIFGGLWSFDGAVRVEVIWLGKADTEQRSVSVFFIDIHGLIGVVTFRICG